ncbi:MAG: hypothetical protein RIT14_1272, partial [Pseudomonadota bacterium]
TDAITLPAIAPGLAALLRLMQAEDASARDALAWTSLVGGLALANAGLGAVHGLAGVIGGVCPAAHGAICGALLGPVLAVNRARVGAGPLATRMDEVAAMIGAALGVDPASAPAALLAWARVAGLAGLTAQGLPAARHREVAVAALASSSMKGNPVALTVDDLMACLAQAA